MASALQAAAQAFLWSTIDDPPQEILLPGPRLVVPVMGSLGSPSASATSPLKRSLSHLSPA
jgi:hypothetical protein